MKSAILTFTKCIILEKIIVIIEMLYFELLEWTIFILHKDFFSNFWKHNKFLFSQSYLNPSFALPWITDTQSREFWLLPLS